jgi:hypothetical protein
VWDGLGHTRFVPLYKVQMDSSMSTRSPKVYPNAGPLEMADAMADLRKSMASVTEERLHVQEAENVVADYSQARWRLPPCGHALRFLFWATRGKLQAPAAHHPHTRDCRVFFQPPSSPARCYCICLLGGGLDASRVCAMCCLCIDMPRYIARRHSLYSSR